MDSLLHPVASLTATTDDASAPAEPAASTNRSKLARAVVLLAIGALVAYAISRFLDRSASVRLDDEAEVVPVVEDAVEELAPEGDERTGEDDRADREHTEEEDGDLERETSVGVTEEDRSPEEIVERSREDVPEPGEMAVDDEVADELLEGADERLDDASDETDEGGDDAGNAGDDSDETDDAGDDDRPD